MGGIWRGVSDVGLRGWDLKRGVRSISGARRGVSEVVPGGEVVPSGVGRSGWVAGSYMCSCVGAEVLTRAFNAFFSSAKTFVTIA